MSPDANNAIAQEMRVAELAEIMQETIKAVENLLKLNRDYIKEQHETIDAASHFEESAPCLRWSHRGVTFAATNPEGLRQLQEYKALCEAKPEQEGEDHKKI